MNDEIAQECTKLSIEEKITFPEVIARLEKANVDAYVVNLVSPSKTYYGGNESFEAPMNAVPLTVASSVFKPDQVAKALQSIQSKRIGYREFLKQITEAGTIFYSVFIKGRKTIYFGRNGEQYIENFPSL